MSASGKVTRLPRLLLAAGLAALAAAPLPLLAQDVRVTVEDVTDDRYSKGTLGGGLRLAVKPVGDGLDGAQGARVVVRSARDDQGASLLPDEPKTPDFRATNVNAGRLELDLKCPSRKAATVSVSGTLELFVPKRDPNAVVRVDDALARPDKPLASKGLKAAKVEVTVLSRKRYDEEKKKQKLDDAKIAEIKAEAKRRGMDEKEVEALIELAKAFEGLGGDVPQNAVILTGKEADLDRIQSVKILDPAGEEVEVGGSSSSSDGKTKTMVLAPRKTPPAKSALVFTILTDRSVVPVPFELKEVPLP